MSAKATGVELFVRQNGSTKCLTDKGSSTYFHRSDQRENLFEKSSRRLRCASNHKLATEKIIWEDGFKTVVRGRKQFDSNVRINKKQMKSMIESKMVRTLFTSKNGSRYRFRL